MRPGKRSAKRIAYTTISAALAGLMLSSCAMQGTDGAGENEESAYHSLFEPLEDSPNIVILGPDMGTSDTENTVGENEAEKPAEEPLEVTSDKPVGDPEEAASKEASEEKTPKGLITEDIGKLAEIAESAAEYRSREEIEREDNEKREAVGITEGRILELMDQNVGNYYFDHLNDAGKRVYAEIAQIVERRGVKIKVSTLDEKLIDTAFQYYLSDHPEVFQVDGFTYTTYTQGDELIKLGFTARYICDQDEENRRRTEIESKVAGIIAGAPQTGDQFDTARYVYDYIVNNTEYEIGAADNQNICSVFLGGKSVCQGYAKAAQLLLNRLGVMTTLVTGTVATDNDPGSRHAWNLTRVNGNEYYLDVTWGDASFRSVSGEEGTEVTRRVNYDYLLVTSSDIMGTHSMDDIVAMPLCTHMEDNYYVRDGAYFTGVNRDQLADLFARGYAEGRESVTLKSSDDAVFAALTDELVTRKGIFDYMADPNRTASLSSSERQRTLTFVL